MRPAAGALLRPVSEAGASDALHASYPMLRVNHSREFKGDDGARTNEAESWFSRLRRSEWGIRRRIQREIPLSIRKEMAWREDRRRDVGEAGRAGPLEQLFTARLPERTVSSESRARSRRQRLPAIQQSLARS